MKPKALSILVVLGMAVVLRAQDATTQPADPAAPYIARWIDQLADADGAQRDHAMVELMGLARDQLPLLKQEAVSAAPLTLAQQAALRDVVRHVYLAGQPYEGATPSRAFLGLQWFDLNPATDDVGQTVESRLPGFCGFRYLHDGDIILKILDHPEVDCRAREAFMHAISSMAPGDTLRLRILRQGRIQDLSIVLDQAPDIVKIAGAGIPDNDSPLRWISQRRQDADEYWQKEFAPLMENHLVALQ